MRGKKSRQAVDAAGLRLAAGDPEDVAEATPAPSRWRRRWCALESLTNSTLPWRPTCSMRCARPGKLRRPCCDASSASRPSASAARGGAGGVLRVVHAAQRADAAEIARSSLPRAAATLHDRLVLDDRCRRPAAGRTEIRTHRACRRARAGRRSPRHQSSSTPTIARAVRLHAGDQPLLDRGVVLHACRGGRDGPRVTLSRMPTRRIERRREIDLVGRALDHVDAARRAAARATGSRCRYCRRAGRRSRPRAADARSAPSWSTCRWCR